MMDTIPLLSIPFSLCPAKVLIALLFQGERGIEDLICISDIFTSAPMVALLQGDSPPERLRCEFPVVAFFEGKAHALT